MLATKTADAIDLVVSEIASGDTPHRNHLGASVLGDPCSRRIWYEWHWACREVYKDRKTHARMSRLFNRGHREEDRIIFLLRCAGVKVWERDVDGQQFRIRHPNGHIAGSLDGICRGVIEMPDVYMNLEIKSHNTKSFTDLMVEKSVAKSKPRHYAQMQTYMHGYGLTHSLYAASNKNDDDLYFEIVPYDEKIAKTLERRGADIVEAKAPPARLSERPEWFECKFCPAIGVCHRGEAPLKNCRTCEMAEPAENGQWRCRLFDAIIPFEVQLKGCAEWRRNPVI